MSRRSIELVILKGGSHGKTKLTIPYHRNILCSPTCIQKVSFYKLHVQQPKLFILMSLLISVTYMLGDFNEISWYIGIGSGSSIYIELNELHAIVL